MSRGTSLFASSPLDENSVGVSFSAAYVGFFLPQVLSRLLVDIMRRPVLELAEKDVDALEKGSPLQNIRPCRILHLLRFDREEMAAIVRMQLKDPAAKIEDALSCDLEMGKLELLEEDRDGGSTHFLSGRLQKDRGGGTAPFGLYPAAPFEVRDDKVKIAFLGDTGQPKALLEKIDGTGVPYKVASLTDARSSGSPLDRLIEKRRKVIVAAFEHGCYETPRGISSEGPARKLGLKSPTLAEHRRKAEQRLPSEMLNGQCRGPYPAFPVDGLGTLS